jgi:hypothetical protein
MLDASASAAKSASDRNSTSESSEVSSSGIQVIRSASEAILSRAGDRCL